MSEVTLTINKRAYRIACEDGQESRLIALGRGIDAKVGDLVERLGQLGEPQLLVMAGLMLADEIDDLQKKLGEVHGSETDRERRVRHSVMAEAERELAEALNDIAERVEAVVTTLEHKIATPG